MTITIPLLDLPSSYAYTRLLYTAVVSLLARSLCRWVVG